MSIAENIARIRANMAEAARESGRDPSEILLVGASKMNDAMACREAVAAGIDALGENRVQEMVQKLAENAYEGAPLHFIGHLQRNKIKYIIDKVCMIHSIESVRLAEAVSEEAAKHGRVIPVLVEVNMAGEETKFGIRPEETEDFIREIRLLPNIQVNGLMTIAPYTENAEDNRIYFRNLKKLYVDIKEKNIDNVVMSHLSMGMTGDYEVAIEEGATMVRVGTGIFGERFYGQI